MEALLDLDHIIRGKERKFDEKMHELFHILALAVETSNPHNQPHLKNHLKKHASEKHFKCEHCITSSSSGGNLKNHMLLVKVLHTVERSQSDVNQSVTFVKIWTQTNIRIYLFQVFDSNEYPNIFA